MARTLEEYSEWLDDRKLLWPAPPQPAAAKATPYLKPLENVRAVTWGVYGTLLAISEGRLEFLHPDPLCMEVALDKTIHEFNMWNSMSRKPGAPWEYMFQQYKGLVEAKRLAASPRAGEPPEVDSAHVWQVLVERLEKKGFEWDEEFYGPIDEFTQKIAWFFHSALQGVGPAPNALMALSHVRQAGLEQGLIANGQCFTLMQLARALAAEGPVPALNKLFTRGCVSLSFQFGVRQPAATLFEACLARLEKLGIAAEEVLHVAPALKEELAPARKLGMRTALYAGDAASLVASPAEVNDPELRPDRILTDLRQIRQIVKTD
ncbi:MAG TPA: HAD family hydrolase [Planctomycetaceae bacterium]|nr:HAD family hydrolase [Planctomycetaceae bacterium]